MLTVAVPQTLAPLYTRNKQVQFCSCQSRNAFLRFVASHIDTNTNNSWPNNETESDLL